MSFRLKVLLGVLLLTIAAFDGVALTLMQQNTAMNLERERARALGNHYALSQRAQAQLRELPASTDIGASLGITHNLLMRSGLAQGTKLYWYKDRAALVVESPFPDAVSDVLLLRDGRRRTMVYALAGGPALLTCGWLPAPYEDYALITASSLAPLERMNEALSQTMTLALLIASAALLLLVYWLLNRLLSPIDGLTRAMRRILKGDYSRRVPVRGSDEIAKLAAGYNRMSETVNRHLHDLQAMAQEKQRFADNLAHEMRTPLTAIHGYAASLLQFPMAQADRDKSLAYIASESKRMQRMSEALLQLSSLRHCAVQIERVSVPALFEHAIRSTHAEMAEKQLSVQVDIGPTILLCDGALIQSLLINLLVNAARASSQGGEIRLRSALSGAIPRLSVSDQGRGMTADQIARAAEPFYRTDKARARRDGGAGLGLALCRQIAECHGATLQITSQPGMGSCVSLLFTTPLQPGEYPETPYPVE